MYDVLAKLRRRIAETQITNNELLDILESAKFVILSKRYPFGDYPRNEDGTIADVEDRYKDLQLRIAVEMVNKLGAEGEITHSENGVSRTYTSASVSPELLSEITPKAGVV